MNLQNILYTLPGIIIGLTVHEYCHALAAYKLGDHTAREMGRLTLNPLKHIDPIGFLFIIIAGFGWAKPVQFNPENLRVSVWVRLSPGAGSLPFILRRALRSTRVSTSLSTRFLPQPCPSILPILTGSRTSETRGSGRQK